MVHVVVLITNPRYLDKLGFIVLKTIAGRRGVVLEPPSFSCLREASTGTRGGYPSEVDQGYVTS